MTCSLQPHLVVTFFHSSPFLVCLSGKIYYVFQTKQIFQQLFLFENLLRGLSGHQTTTARKPQADQVNQGHPKSHVIFIGTTCFHMGTVATGQACYFAEGDSSFLNKNCGKTALMGCSWCPSCPYIRPMKNHWVAYSAASRCILCIVVGFLIGVVFTLPILACLAFIICCFTLSRVSSWFNLSYPDISYVIFSSFLLSYLYVSIYTPKNQKL